MIIDISLGFLSLIDANLDSGLEAWWRDTRVLDAARVLHWIRRTLYRRTVCVNSVLLSCRNKCKYEELVQRCTSYRKCWQTFRFRCKKVEICCAWWTEYYAPWFIHDSGVKLLLRDVDRDSSECIHHVPLKYKTLPCTQELMHCQNDPITQEFVAFKSSDVLFTLSSSTLANMWGSLLKSRITLTASMKGIRQSGC